jgi:hypothetical protein
MAVCPSDELTLRPRTVLDEANASARLVERRRGTHLPDIDTPGGTYLPFYQALTTQLAAQGVVEISNADFQYSVEIDDNGEVTVSDSLPASTSVAFFPIADLSANDRGGDVYAALWAYAAHSPRRVINRPNGGVLVMQAQEIANALSLPLRNRNGGRPADFVVCVVGAKTHVLSRRWSISEDIRALLAGLFDDILRNSAWADRSLIFQADVHVRGDTLDIFVASCLPEYWLLLRVNE